MTLTIELTSDVEERLKTRALANGYEKVSDYAKKLLVDDTNKKRTLDEIFAPFRKHTEQITETEIDGLVKQARQEIHAEKSGNPHK